MASRELALTLSTAVNDDILGTKGAFPRIRVKSLDSRYLTPVIDALVNEYKRTLDPRIALLGAARAADLVNRRIFSGDAMPATRGHDGEACDDYHVCPTCLRLTKCRFLVLSLVSCLEACSACRRREVAFGRAPLLQRLVERGIHKALIQEGIIQGLDVSSARLLDLQKRACESVRPYLDAEKGRYYDSYLGRWVPMQVDSVAHNARNPMMPSADAVFPFWLVDEDGQSNDPSYWIHCEGNLRMTSVALNQLKHIFPPAFLAHVAEWVNTATKSPAARSEMLRKCDGIWQLASLSPYTRSGRMLQEKVDAQSWGRALASWRSGRLISHADRQETGLPVWIFTTARLLGRGYEDEFALWDGKARHRLRAIALEIGAHFGLVLKIAPDGCPWFPVDCPMPDDYDWSTSFSFCLDRFTRLREYCNRRFESMQQYPSRVDLPPD